MTEAAAEESNIFDFIYNFIQFSTFNLNLSFKQKS